MDSDFPLLSVFLYMLWFFCFVLWIFLLFTVVTDVFRSQDLSGWGKAGWTAAILILPLIGVLAYLIVRGHSMHERQNRDAAAAADLWRAQVRSAAGRPSTADELSRLAELRDHGVISSNEFEREKTKILA
ncbi:Short C-terminal domain-containing protein [Parafrankia irregularis]|uniref:Short C-terminal domain-containing protein n=1 Tax=Parafrankia irregularis TaxID=795642 RepID=A0A0S4QKM3_9ACTN|nr:MULTISPECIES: SHOCT domain-containing protein [Parafrankia]MBE3202066.1 SHOCT domain-containing protein [Parafrankia sp. CH37]CUU55844.1 Short C-terminal domain-containing protein [Parafrankia irregularis]